MLAALLWALGPTTALAAPQLRFSVDEHGDFAMIGNTLGFNCSSSFMTTDPVVGTVDRANCGTNINDHGIDVFWRSDQPAAGQALADPTITAAQARSTAVLALPPNAVVLYARLYWATLLPGGATAGTTATLERAGTFSKTVTADATRGSNTVGISPVYYQSSADITREVQAYGAGAYRVGNIAALNVVDLDQDVGFSAWTMVVFYRLDTAPVRNLALFDGLDLVTTGLPATATLNGFLVPTGAVEGRLGVVSYDGNADLVGDALSFNGHALSDTANPVDNFFNSTRSNLGVPVSVSGDLPQETGAAASMNSFDMDIVDISSYLTAGDTAATLLASTASDTYFLGAFITAVTTLKPVFTQTNKTFTNLTRTDGTIQPGDKLQFTIATTNTGTDTGVNVVVSDALPVGMTYVAGTLQVDGVAKTDQALDDEAEYVVTSRTITARLGSGATAMLGGSIDPNGTAVVKFQVTVDPNVSGVLKNQATISAQGKAALMVPDLTVASWSSGDGTSPNVPTVVPVDSCLTSAKCTGLTPICDTSSHPYTCVCNADSDCPARTVCDTTGSRACVACTASKSTYCDGGGTGGVCLGNNTCGCSVAADCSGRLCNTETSQCPPGAAEVSVTITRPQGGTTFLAGATVVYSVTVTNNGPSAVKNLSLSDTLPAGATTASWTCAGTGSATCPAAAGSGGIGSLISLPAGGTLVYTVSVQIPSTFTGGMATYTVSAPVPPGYVDAIPTNNTATSSIALGNGPNLAISVTNVQNQDGSVTSDLVINNKGTGAAQGATVSYDLPSGITVSSIDGGQGGWTCTQGDTQIVCTTTQAIAAGSAAPDIHITIRGPADVSSVMLHAVVSPTVDGMVVSDADQSDNSYSGSADFGGVRVEGGGFGCSATPRDHSPLAGTLSGLVLLALLFLQQRKRAVRR